MPDYIDNSLKIIGPDAASVVALVRSEKQAFDFDKVCPMPDILEGSYCGTAAELGLVMQGVEDPSPYAATAQQILQYPWIRDAGVTTEKDLLDYLRRHPSAAEYEERGWQAAYLIAATGYSNWYYWRMDNWGTKWNAIDSGGGMEADSLAGFGFRTAWDPPVPVMQTLSRRYPATSFELRYVDECDANGGRFIFREGLYVECSHDDVEGEPILPDWSEIRAALKAASAGSIQNARVTPRSPRPDQ